MATWTLNRQFGNPLESKKKPARFQDERFTDPRDYFESTDEIVQAKNYRWNNVLFNTFRWRTSPETLVA